MADDSSVPRNRKERRAQAKSDGTLHKTKPTATDHLRDRLPRVEYKKPDFDAPRPAGTKTLYEMAAERQEELQREGFYDRYDDKYAHGENAGDHQFWTSPEDEPIGAMGEATVWSLSLAMFHFTLDVLVFHQYRQQIEWREIWVRVLRVLPALWIVIYLLRTRRVLVWKRTRQVFFFAASVVAGTQLIKRGNKHGYFAVMKTAPPLGTLWIWSVIEMDLWFAVAHVGVVGVYMWWNGFKNF